MTTHQLFATSDLHTKYPDYFTNSSNQKYVSVLAVYLFCDEPKQEDGIEVFRIPQYCRFHADFVQDDECLDQYVCMANVPLFHKRKYKQYNNSKYFNVWFSDYKGTKIELGPNHHFVLELLLEY